MFRSATFKLTMWYLAIVMAISLAFSAILYQVTTGELDRGLNHETEQIFDEFPVFQNSPYLRPGKEYQDSSHRILLRLISFNLVVLVGAGYASYWLARRTLKPIEAAHEQQKRFTADVSHELRTPLTAIHMESEVALLNPKASAQELRSVLQSNLEETAKLDALVNNLLRLTRLEAEELQQTFSELSAPVVAAAALTTVAATAKAKKIKFENQVKDVPLYGDEANLVQLLVILLDNAIKYSPKGSTVELKSGPGKDHTTLTVVDHGVGIEREALEHVFDRFYRADNARNKSDGQGYGLGLSIAQMIAELHNGTVTLHSQVGKGTSATITLPNLRQPGVEHQQDREDQQDKQRS